MRRCLSASLFALLVVAAAAAPSAQARTRTFCSGSFVCGVPVISDPTISLPGHAVACGKDSEAACDSGAQCDAGYGPVDNTLTPNFPYTVVCPTIDPSPPCDSPSTYNIPDDTIATACYVCGQDDGPGTSRIGCNLPTPCAPGLEHITTAPLHGPITLCPSYLPPDPPNVSYPASSETVSGTIDMPFPLDDIPYSFTYQVPAVNQAMPTSAQIVNSEGICTDGLPEDLSGGSREPWPAAESISPLPGTVFLIHGRGAKCDGGRSRVLDNGTIYPRNPLVYCVEYAQTSTGGPDEPPSILTVRVLPVVQEESGEGTACVATSSCEFDRVHPVFSREAAELTVPALVDVLADAIESVPTVGQITLMPHSQGGYIARELLHRHYDELRWRGRNVVRLMSLAHPYFAKEQDPQLYAPWLCSGFAEGNLDCAVGRWLRGWDDWLGTSPPGHIDDLDFPQIHWVAVSGDGFDADGVTPSGITIESLDGATCSFIFGGFDGTAVVGDTSVPIQSSLGIDEFDFFPIDALSFDGSSMERCTHNAACMAAGRLARVPADLPYASPRAARRGALEFDGVDDAVAATDPGAVADLAVTGTALTVELWVRPEGDQVDGALVAKEGEYTLRLVAGELRWGLAAGGAFSERATGYFPPAHRWSHVALVYDGAVGRVYANGVEVHAQAASGSIGDSDPGQNQLWLGGREGGTDFFDGQLDEIRIWSRALSLGEIVADLALAPSSTVGLLARWSFGEIPGDNNLLDSGPNGLQLALDGLGAAATPLRRLGEREYARQGGVVYTDGAGTFAAVSNPASLPALEVSEALTMEAWVYPRGPGPAAGGAILNKEGEYQLTRLADGTAAFTLASASPGWSTRVTGVSVPERTWTHLALVFDGVEARLYRNGILEYSEPATGPIGDFPSHAGEDELWIGGRQLNDRTASVQWFHGAIDEVRVWSVARTQPEIAADMAMLLDGGEPGLLGNWRFDDHASEVVFDSGPGRHHGALGRSRANERPALSYGPDLPTHPSGFVRDTDLDGVGDSDETLVLATLPGVSDNDGDGLSDGEEVVAGTDPNAQDTDGDGFIDPVEIAAGSNPLDPNSTPPAAIPVLHPFGVLALGAALLGVGLAGARSRRR